MNVDLPNELKEFETKFEREETVDMWKFGKKLDFPCQKFCGNYMFFNFSYHGYCK
jgi:hypothetical protein